MSRIKLNKKRTVSFCDFIPKQLSKMELVYDGISQGTFFTDDTDIVNLTKLIEFLNGILTRLRVDKLGYDAYKPLMQILAEDYCTKYPPKVRYVPDDELPALLSELNSDINSFIAEYDWLESEIKLEHCNKPVKSLLETVITEDVKRVMTKCDATDETTFKEFFTVIGKQFLDNTDSLNALTRMYYDYRCYRDMKSPTLESLQRDTDAITEDLLPIAFQYLKHFIECGCKVSCDTNSITILAHILRKWILDAFDEIQYHSDAYSAADNQK